MGAFIGLWIAQIVFGVIVFFTNPRRSDASTKAQNARNLAIFGGLIPCVGLMLLMQVIWLVIYRSMLAREQSVNRRLSATLESDFGSTTTRPALHPARETEQQKRSDNPFL